MRISTAKTKKSTKVNMSRVLKKRQEIIDLELVENAISLCRYFADNLLITRKRI